MTLGLNNQSRRPFYAKLKTQTLMEHLTMQVRLLNRLSQVSIFIALLAANTLISTNASANIDLKYDDNIELIAVNGELVEDEGTTRLEDTKAKQQLVFNVRSFFMERGNREKFISDVIVVTFDTASVISTNALTLSAGTVRSKKAGKKFNKNPQISLETNTGNQVSFVYDTLKVSGMQLGRNYQAEIAAYNQSSDRASVAALAPAVTVATPVAASKAQVQPQPQSTAPSAPAPQASTEMTVKTIEQDQAEILQMLDYWYNKADDTTKAKFKDKINN
ncbi:DUF2057 domain-containing protein [Shewanella maritima]|uniref:UPF0319 protein EXU30_04730 n=1 Tax=Shewanella maritima TaxID=2520507 RepID=A0A411PES7_9GAMM|nr:DUF2057 domain-containing protein [Shewanella maritima]QBF82087.1 DUF2057 domain-containing protein [Shewanella maritima]